VFRGWTSMDGSSLLNPHSSTLDEGPLWPEA
jgi:hypothetical protein